MKILDCTFRDGGYYTNWDFEESVVNTYLKSLNDLPVDYLEIGYRSNALKGYLGKFFYSPVSVLEKTKDISKKKLAVILNEKDVRSSDTENVLGPCRGLIDLVRIAIDPDNFSRALILAESVKKMGFEVGFNVMYMSTWSERKEFLSQIKEVKGLADYFYMVDSFGGVFPSDVVQTIDLVRSQTGTPIGFHGHDNLELALINTLTAIDHGVDIVDSTIMGMGRGAGNLKTELLLTVLNAQNKLEVDFNPLSKVVDVFSDLHRKYEWGSNLPYMVSGANSLPQKQVMEWVSKRYFSFNSIIRALSNQSKGIKDNQKFPLLDLSKYQKKRTGLIVGGGESVSSHSNSIGQFLKNNQEVVVIHASSKNALEFQSLSNDQIFCLVGNEGHRLESVFGDIKSFTGTCILPPYPREMGTYVPKVLEKSTFELKEINFTESFKLSHSALALQTAIELNLDTVYVVGYDGYAGNSISEKDQELMKENEFLFQIFKDKNGRCISLTPTKYVELEHNSIYSFI